MCVWGRGPVNTNSSNGGNDHSEPLEPLFIGFLPGGSAGPFPLNTVKTVSPAHAFAVLCLYIVYQMYRAVQ